MKGKDKVAMSDIEREAKISALVERMKEGRTEATIVKFVQMNIRNLFYTTNIVREALDRANEGLEINGDGFESYMYHSEILDEFERELKEIWDPSYDKRLDKLLATWNPDIEKTDDIFDKALEKSMEKVVELSKPKKVAEVIEFKPKKAVND
jgi:hypothetical protein